MAQERFRHIVPTRPPETEPFTSTSIGGFAPKIPDRDRQPHSDFLKKTVKSLGSSGKRVGHRLYDPYMIEAVPPDTFPQSSQRMDSVKDSWQLKSPRLFPDSLYIGSKKLLKLCCCCGHFTNPADGKFQITLPL